jgi:hypothetical protein
MASPPLAARDSVRSDNSRPQLQGNQPVTSLEGRKGSQGPASGQVDGSILAAAVSGKAVGQQGRDSSTPPALPASECSISFDRILCQSTATRSAMILKPCCH